MAVYGQKNRVGAGFQAIVFSVSFIFLAFFFAFKYNTFVTHDPYPILLSNPKSNKSIMVGMHVAHFNEFNISKNKFSMDGTIWFAFNPREISLEKIKKFTIYNGVLQYVSDPMIIEHNGLSIAQFRIRTLFHTALDYRMFPLDDHRINLMVINNYLPQDIKFISNSKDIVFSESLYIPGWRVVATKVRTGLREVVLEKDEKRYSDMHQEAIISFECERTDPSLIINILLTLLLMLFISVLTFSSDEDSVLIVTVGIVALVGYRTVMQAMAPPQVGYFMFSDYMYLLALVGVIFTLFCGIMTRERESSVRAKQISIITVYAFFCGMCALLTLIA